jgi:enoyl-CoA hydratase
MPEVRIGFSPDVGGTYLLSAIPGEVGAHLALTGQRIGADDANACGFADCRVSSDRIADVGRRLAECRSKAAVDEVLASLSVPVGNGHLVSSKSWIARCYAGGDAEAIVAALQASPESEAQQAAKAIARGAPASLKLAHASLRRAHGLRRLEA